MTQLSLSQQITWDILCQDPASFAHRWGAILTQLDSDALHKRCDNLLLDMMQFSDKDAVSILKTFLCVYKLPLKVVRLENFHLFNQKYGDYIFKNSDNLKPFERYNHGTSNSRSTSLGSAGFAGSRAGLVDESQSELAGPHTGIGL